MQSNLDMKQNEVVMMETVDNKIRTLQILSIVDFFLLLTVFAKSALFTLSYVKAHPTLLAPYTNDLNELGLNIEYVVISTSIVVAILGMLIQYHVLKRLFKKSVNEFVWQETLFLCLSSSVLSGIVVFSSSVFFVMSFELNRILLNGLYGVLLLLLTNYFVWKKREQTMFDTKLIMKLNILLGIYSSLIIVLGALGIKLV